MIFLEQHATDILSAIGGMISGSYKKSVRKKNFYFIAK